MTPQEQFLKSLEEIKDLAALQGGFISNIQLDECMPDMNDTQRALIKDYLKQNKIGLDKPLEGEESPEETGEDGHLNIYLDELKESEPVNEDKKKLLLREALNGGQLAKENLIEAYLPAVVDIAKLYAGQGADMADLIGEGNVALTVSVENLNCVDTPEDADSMIVKMIMNSMEAFIGLENEEEQMMEQVLTDTAKVLEQAKQMAEELLRKVTVEELSKETDIPEDKIREAMQFAKECMDYIEEEGK